MENVLQIALRWCEEHQQNQSINRKCAFANSVENLVTGLCGGFGGPSLRQHLCTHRSIKIKPAGKWTFQEAVEFCEPLCFKPAELFLSELQWIYENEKCFDDDPEDIEAVQGKIIHTDKGWRFDPERKLNDFLVDILAKKARKREGNEKVCLGIIDDVYMCGKGLFKQARGCYCKNHRFQNPVQKEMVKRSKKKARNIKMR